MRLWRRAVPELVFLLFAAIVCFSRFRLGHAPLPTYDDDFFYYLRASTNLLQTGRSTFDGVRLTNGYHPLWFVVVTAVGLCTSTFWFYAGLQVVEFLLAWVTFRLLRTALRRRTAYPLLADGMTLIACCLGVSLARGGMEIALVFPLVAAWLAYRLRPAFTWSGRQAAGYGLLLSLVVLSRLDTILLAALVLGVDVAGSWSVLRRRPATPLWLLTGGLPFAAYLAANRFWFHMWLPISGNAKQLRFHHWPTAVTLRSLFLLHSAPLQCTIWLAFGLLAASLVAYSSSRLPAVEKRVALALVLFPIVHLVVIATLSDWAVWPWYFYPFVLVWDGAALLLLPAATSRQADLAQRLQWPMYAALLGFAAAVCTVSTTSWARYHDNAVIAAFMDAHPGTYAMGDMSGMLSMMTHAPIVQTEGLMEDRAFLVAIRKQEFLGDVLVRYGANYYIPLTEQVPNAAYAVKEPAQAGADSPAMHGFVCNGKALFRPNTVNLRQIFAVKDVTRTAAEACAP